MSMMLLGDGRGSDIGTQSPQAISYEYLIFNIELYGCSIEHLFEAIFYS